MVAWYKKTALVSHGQIYLRTSSWLFESLNETRNYLYLLLSDAQFVTHSVYKKNLLLYVQWLSKKVTLYTFHLTAGWFFHYSHNL